VHLQQDDDAPTIEFQVIDSGIGIAPEELGKVFRPFVQAGRTESDSTPGTGLGLAICRRLAELLGGQIAVESQMGHGTTFFVQLPVGPLNDVPLVELAQPNEGVVQPCDDPTEPASLHGRILLAEDGPDNQRLINFILRRAGAEVVTVDNGAKAIDAVEQSNQLGQPFDLVLMDMQMPVLDGYDATRHLRRAGSHLPIIALTAHAMSKDRQLCLDAGCDDYASKPIDRKAFLSLVGRYLASAVASN
jgi:CheY-like chemotaxis protein